MTVQFFNNASFDAAYNSGNNVYTLIVQAEAEDIPDNSQNISMVIFDETNKAARVLMNKTTANQYTIVRVFSTTEANNSIPTWGSGLKAACTNVAEQMEIPFTSAVVLCTGQSNVVGINSGKPNLPPELFNQPDPRIKFQPDFYPAFDSYDKVYAGDNLQHISGGGGLNMGPYVPFAARLLEEGYTETIGIFGGVNAAQIFVYGDGQPTYISVKDALVKALNASPRNKLTTWIHQQGETDQALGTTPAQWVVAVKDFRDRLTADILSECGVDISRVPFMSVGMHGDYRNSGSYNNVNDMEQGIADVPNNVPFSAYVPLGNGLSRASDSANEGGSTDTTHLSAFGQVTNGNAIYAKLDEARANISFGPPDVTEPTLTNPLGQETGPFTATGSVVTNEANGTLYSLISQNATETENTIVTTGETQSVNTIGTQEEFFTGLSESTPYYVHFVHIDAAGNVSAVASSPQFFTAVDTDTTAPVLSFANAEATGQTTATGSVTTNEAGGTLYVLASVNSTELAAAVLGGGVSQAVLAAGVQNASITALTEDTTYFTHYLHRDFSGNDSNVVSSGSFRTDAAGDVTSPVLTNPQGAKVDQNNATGAVTTNEAGGNLFYIATTNSSESEGTVTGGSSQAVSTTGVQNVTISGLTAGTPYYNHFVHIDAAGNPSLVASSTAYVTDSASAPSTPLTDALAPTHYFRSDFGLNESGGSFVSWQNLGSQGDVTTTLGGTPTVDSNGVNFNGNSGLVWPNSDVVFANNTATSLIFKFKGDGGRLFSNLNNFINLDIGSVAVQAFLNNTVFTSSITFNDDVEHVVGVSILDGGNLLLVVDGAVSDTLAAGGFNANSSQTGLGVGQSGSDSMDGYIKSWAATGGAAWTLTDFTNIASEMP